MNFIIPMAGRGQRFKDVGYSQPKMLIEVHGKTLLEWSIDSLPLEICSHLIFVGLAEHEKDHHISDFIRSKYTGTWKLDFLFIDQTTGGQAETVLLSKDLWKAEADLVIFNIDTRFHSDTLLQNLVNPLYDGVLGSFHSDLPLYSYAQTDAEGIITHVVEKQVISHHALTGLYHFKRASDFAEVAQEAISKGEKHGNEYYVAPMYNQLIKKGHRFILDQCSNYDILGTPKEVETFSHKRI